MKRLFVCLCLLFVLLVVVKRTFAYSSFINSASNPLHHSFTVLQHSTTYSDGTYHMFYTGFNENSKLIIGLAESHNSIDWDYVKQVRSLSVLDFHDPSYLEVNGDKYLFYVTEPNEGSGVNIQFTKATLDPQFNVVTETPINLPRKYWNTQKISCPSVYHENGEYRFFYCGTASYGWGLGMAISTNGVTFEPCSDPILNTSSDYGNSVLLKDELRTNIYHLYVHMDMGIAHYTTQGLPHCASTWSLKGIAVPKSLASNSSQIISPDIVKVDDSLHMFYTGRSPNNGWKLHLATSVIKAESNPMLVFLPGMLGSWNKEELLHNTSTSIFDWNLAPFVREYDGLIQSLVNQGYVEGKDYIIVPYDWRKSIEFTSNSLDEILDNKVWNLEPDRKINLIGHSLGGVISRIYAQKHPDKVSHITSVASPHRGTAYVYKPVEAGEFETEDNSLWLAGKILTAVNYGNYTSDKDTIQNTLPIVNDLFPTDSFLHNRKNVPIAVENMSIINNYLRSYNGDISSISDKFTSFYSSASNSLFGYVVGSKRSGESGAYVDGKPLQRILSSGDGFITSSSEQLGPDSTELNYDHGQIIANTDALKNIFEKSSIDIDDQNLVAGGSTQLIPSLIFLIQSPATISVESNGVTYSEQEGVVLISNAQSNSYTIKVQGLDQGRYTLTIGQNSLNSIMWEQVVGEIVNDPASTQLDEYVFHYDQLKSSQQFENDGICRRKLFDRKSKKHVKDVKCKKVRHSKI